MAVEEELRNARTHLGELSRREAELRDETATLDGILGAAPVEPRAPLLPVPRPAPTPVPATPAASPPRKRRRKGSRREQMLPVLQARFGTATFTTEDVTNLVLEAEGGDHRKAYFAAWSLVRDLAEDAVIVVASEEGAGPRKSARTGSSTNRPGGRGEHHDAGTATGRAGPPPESLVDPEGRPHGRLLRREVERVPERPLAWQT